MRAKTGRPAHRPLEHPECGTVQTYWRGCRCRPCGLAANQYRRELKAVKRMLEQKRAPKPALPVQIKVTHKEQALIEFLLGKTA